MKIDLSPSPLRGEGKGEGDSLYLFPPSPPSSPAWGEEVIFKVTQNPKQKTQKSLFWILNFGFV
jgi:hypothetical protein